MSEDQPTFKERLKRFTLLKWGWIFIFSGLMVNVLSMAGRPKGRLNAQEAAAVYGQLAATGLIIVAGIVLIIMHFVRAKRKR